MEQISIRHSMMKHLIILLLTLCSMATMAQTVTNPPSGSKPYGTPVATPSGEIMVGRSGSYTYITRKAYTDSLIALGYTKLQVDSAIAAEIATIPTGVLEAIDEGNGIGYRIKGKDPDNYGNIGLGAVDFSSSSVSS